MSSQLSLFSLPVWLAFGQLIFPRIASGDILWESTGPKASDVGNCNFDIWNPPLAEPNDCPFAGIAAAIANIYPTHPVYFNNLIQKVDDDTAIVNFYNYPVDSSQTISFTVSISNVLPAGATQSPLGLSTSAVWPTVLQSALLQASVDPNSLDPHNYLLTGIQAFGDPEYWKPQQQQWVGNATNATLQEWWGFANQAPCTSGVGSQVATPDFNGVDMNHDFVAIGCDPSPCDFSSETPPNVMLYDPMYNGQTTEIYIVNQGDWDLDGDWKKYSGTFDTMMTVPVDQGYITLSYDTWYDSFDGLWCGVQCLPSDPDGSNLDCFIPPDPPTIGTAS